MNCRFCKRFLGELVNENEINSIVVRCVCGTANELGKQTLSPADLDALESKNPAYSIKIKDIKAIPGVVANKLLSERIIFVRDLYKCDAPRIRSIIGDTSLTGFRRLFNAYYDMCLPLP